MLWSNFRENTENLPSNTIVRWDPEWPRQHFAGQAQVNDSDRGEKYKKKIENGPNENSALFTTRS